jgi:nucleotide-binding universal stress UspA family protein
MRLRERSSSTQELLMNSLRHLICGVDGSDPARRAAATALRLADRLGDRLVLVHVIPPRPPMSLAAAPVGPHPVEIADMHKVDRTEAEAAFESVEPDVAPASADRVIEHGDAAARLSALASEKDARLIVVGTRGRGIATSALLGSVSAELAGRASRPVVVVPDAEPEAGRGGGGIVCGVDGSKAAAAVAVTAAGLAHALGLSLTLVSADAPHADGYWSHESLAAASAHAREAPQLERVAAVCDAAQELARVAFEHDAALLVVGSRGRGPVRSAILGSVSARLARLAPCPVVIVPPDAQNAAWHGQGTGGEPNAA